MSELIVKPVSSRKDRKQFVNFPWKLYRGDPYWVPPLRANHLELLNYKPHPFYEYSEIQTFLALRGGEPCGRIAAIVNRAHNQRYQEQRGFFGFFECIDDQSVADALFLAARTWLTERGMQAMRGPVNPSMNYEIGLLIDGFDSMPTFMMTYNPPYYGKLFEAAGLQKTQDMYAFWGHVEMLQDLDKKLAFVVEEATRRFDVKLRTLTVRGSVKTCACSWTSTTARWSVPGGLYRCRKPRWITWPPA